MPVTENLTQSQGLLAELQRLQRRVSEQLAEKETELRGLSGTGTRLDQLQETLDGLQPEPGRWRAERQALMDRRDALSHAVATAEARWKQTLETANDNGRELQEELEQAHALLRETQQALAEKDAARQAQEAGTAKERERNAMVLGRAQEQLEALRADKQRQDEELAALMSRVAGLEQEVQLARANREEQRISISDEEQKATDDVEERRASLDIAGEEIRRQLAMVDALRAEQERLTVDRAALADRVNELEHTLEARSATQPVEEDWNAERTQLLDQLIQLEQALQHTEQQVAEDRDRLLADLNQARQQLADVSQQDPEWQSLDAERAQLQARLQSLEQSWMAREAAINQERAEWQQQLQRLTGSSAAAPSATPAPPRGSGLSRILGVLRRRTRRSA
ncbi:MAG: hypothetical protein E6I88_06180 [Chloroflexi bacterium]|nr:MAG: hypothetical protein E6I88_06180 [Chloroflexota bacterium]TME46100.1 MAG: hypothetical protein E6I56_07970 [Chloroflexota bacterium]